MGQLDESRMPLAITHHDELGLIESIFTEPLYDKESGRSFELMVSQADALRRQGIIDFNLRDDIVDTRHVLHEGVTWEDFSSALRKLK